MNILDGLNFPKCGKIDFTHKNSSVWIFQKVLRGGGTPPVRWGWENFVGGGGYFVGWWESDEEWFWPLEPFQNQNHHFVNIEHQLKSKLARTVSTKSIKLN